MADAGPFYEALLALALDELKIRYEYEPIDIIPNVPELYEGNKVPKIYIVPDFVISDAEGNPKVILYVTHWRASDTSHYKFWRTIEELFEHKVGFKEVISINVLFEVRKEGSRLISDGWREGLLYAMDWIFDKSIYFWPTNLIPIVERNRLQIKTNKVPIIKEKIRELLSNDQELRDIFEQLLKEVDAIFKNLARKKMFDSLWSLERKYCKNRNPNEADIEVRTGRWRRGSLLYFLISVIMDTKTRILKEQWKLIHRLATSTKVSEFARELPFHEARELLELLKQITVRRKQGKPIQLVQVSEPISLHSSLYVYSELVWFVSELENLPEVQRNMILQEIDKIKQEVSVKKSVFSAMEDIRNPDRIKKKVQFFLNNLKSGVTESLIKKLIIRCRENPSFLGFKETLNFVFELFMIARKLSTYKLTPIFNREFRRKFGFSLSQIFSNTTRMLIRDIYTNSDIKFVEGKHNKKEQIIDEIFDLFAKIFFERLKVEELDESYLFKLYLERKVLRLIGAQPDINPFERILQKRLCEVSLRKGGPFYSIFSDYLETINPRWKRNASTTFPLIVGPPGKEVPIKVIAATGRENVNHKRKEMCGRLRAIRYKYDPQMSKIARRFPTEKRFVIVIDGDWTYYDAENLYESGYEVLQLHNLDKLKDLIRE